MSYSQNNEEALIIPELVSVNHPIGRFLDIGAYDGKTFSNTLRLIELGWSGVCVEPSPGPLHSLIQRHKDNPRIKIVGLPVHPTGHDLVRFYDSSGDAVSTTDEGHRKKWSSGGTHYCPFTTRFITLDELLTITGPGLNFLNIDVEGKNMDLFEVVPFGKLDELQLVCVEHEGRHQDMAMMAKPFNFRPVLVNAENLILARSLQTSKLG